jgi:hypothetical protein
MGVPKEKIRELINNNFVPEESTNKDDVDWYSTNEIIGFFSSIDNINKDDLIDVLTESGFKIEFIIDQYKWIMKKK